MKGFHGNSSVRRDGSVIIREIEDPSESDFLRIRELDQLEDLKLWSFHGKVKPAGLAHIQDLYQLKILWLRGPWVSDTEILNLQGLTNLEHLNLGHTDVTDDGLASLQGLKNLKSVDLRYTSVTDVGLEHLNVLTSLTSLELGSTQVTEAGVNELKKSLPKCKIHH